MTYYNENNKNAAHPKPIYDEGGKDAYYNETYLKNGSYLKIRNISLGYTFPNRLLTHTGLSALRMYALRLRIRGIFSAAARH